MKKITIMASVALMMSACGGNEKEYDATGIFEATETTVFAEQNGALLTFSVNEGDTIEANKKQAILDELAENNVLLDAVREENPALKDCDYFDIISHVAFDQKPLTRHERIEGVKKRNYLTKYEGQARKVIEGLMEKYGETDVTNIENPQILSLNPFAQIAKRPRIMKGIFKSPEEYNEAVRDLENELYNIG